MVACSRLQDISAVIPLPQIVGVLFSLGLFYSRTVGPYLPYLPTCLVPVQRFPSPSRSIHLGDVSEANELETPRQKQKYFRLDHVTRNALAARNNEA